MNYISRTSYKRLTWVALILILVGCGQKGPLRMPNKPTKTSFLSESNGCLVTQVTQAEMKQ